MARYFLTCDIGTSVTKTVLYNENFQSIETASEENISRHEQPCWLEQDPKQWWASATREIRKVVGNINSRDIAGIATCAQMHAPILVDERGEPLFGCLSWPDGRTVKLVEEVSKETGVPQPYFTSTAPKILWIKRHVPTILDKTYKVLLPKDFIRMKLSDTFCTDTTDAPGTAMYDQEKKTWNWKVVDYIGLDHDKLPEVYPSEKVVGVVSEKTAKETGLTPGIPVIAGTADFGIGRNVERAGVKRGNILLYLGTGPGIWWMGTGEGERRTSSDLCILGVAGTAPQWFKNTFCQEESARAEELGTNVFELLEDEASRIEPGVGGLIFLPHLMGERAYSGRTVSEEGRLNPYARGVFFGLCMGHTRIRMYRAVLEGITYHLRLCWEHIQAANPGSRSDLIVATGGGAKSRLWRQIIADNFGIQTCRLKELETSTLGLACLISVGTGFHKNFQDAVSTVENPTTDTLRPNEENRAIYDENFRKYKLLENGLEPLFNL